MLPAYKGIITTNGVELWTEDFGPRHDRAAVLISGADSPGSRWDLALVEGLTAAGHRVVRFDNRDCGLSTKIDPDTLYDLNDMARDVVGLLDALGVRAAHFAGRSMGGMIAQLLALDHRPRVLSLSLLITSPGLGDERLSSPDDGFVEKMAMRHLAPPPRTRDAKIQYLMDLFALFAGSAFAFEEDRLRAASAAEVDRSWYPETGHGHAAWSVPSRLDRLGAIDVPVLSVHGTLDPVVPPDHAQALVDNIAGARLHLIEGMGHETPAALTPFLLNEMLALFERATSL